MSSLLYHRVARIALRSFNSSKSAISLAQPINPQVQLAASISTSKKDRETIATEITTKAPQEKSEKSDTKKSWQSLGFDWDDKDTDQNYANLVFFSTVTIGLVGSAFIMAYWPDHQLRNWSQREAHIELARREALGLPLIDPNLVPPENVPLPSEEELGDFEIVI